MCKATAATRWPHWTCGRKLPSVSYNAFDRPKMEISFTSVHKGNNYDVSWSVLH